MRQCHHADTRSAKRPHGSHGCQHGAACGNHIVHQQDVLAIHLFGVIDRKHAGDIARSFRSTGACLLRIVSDTLQMLCVHRNLGYSTQTLGYILGLIITALTEATTV